MDQVYHILMESESIAIPTSEWVPMGCGLIRGAWFCNCYFKCSFLLLAANPLWSIILVPSNPSPYSLSDCCITILDGTHYHYAWLSKPSTFCRPLLQWCNCYMFSLLYNSYLNLLFAMLLCSLACDVGSSNSTLVGFLLAFTFCAIHLFILRLKLKDSSIWEAYFDLTVW